MQGESSVILNFFLALTWVESSLFCVHVCVCAEPAVSSCVGGPVCLWCSNWSECGCSSECVSTSEGQAGLPSQ